MWFNFHVVATPEELPRDRVSVDAVVRPLSRVAQRPCARPGCPAPARATLTFTYHDQVAVIDRLLERAEPQTYDLCASHASRTRPPHGWTLRDRRPEEERKHSVPPSLPVDLGSERTVAVLAAALRAVPAPSEADADRTFAGPIASASDREMPATATDAIASGQPSDPEDEPSPVLGAEGPFEAEDEHTSEVSDIPTPRPPLAVREHRAH